MGWLRLLGSFEIQVSFAKEPFKTDYILQKRPTILRSLLIIDTQYLFLTPVWGHVSVKHCLCPISVSVCASRTKRPLTIAPTLKHTRSPYVHMRETNLRTHNSTMRCLYEINCPMMITFSTSKSSLVALVWGLFAQIHLDLRSRYVCARVFIEVYSI